MGRPLALHQVLSYWPYLAAVLHLFCAVVASGHVVLSKRDSAQPSVGWG